MNKTELPILIPTTESDRQAIRDQLDRVLSCPHFSHSKRYPAFLHYIVEQALAGKADEIKERSIGIEVFHRNADYETNTDPIVRVTAGAIRRRLQQYYYEPDHERELHIELPAGSYVPIFRMPDAVAVSAVAKGQHSTEPAGPSMPGSKYFAGVQRAATRWMTYAAAALVGAVVLLSSFSYRQEAANNPVNQFWSPLTSSRDAVLLGVANARENDFGENVSLPDMLTMSGVENVLKSRSKPYRLVDISGVDPKNQGGGPIVFVVPYHNPWALQLTQGLRYSFEVNTTPAPATGQPKQTGAIKDSFSQTEWHGSHTGIHDDNYAIVARFEDQALGREVILISGLTPAATTAAGQLLTDPKYTDLLINRAPSDWQKMNLEAVVKTQAENHQPGPPEIEATYFWQ